MNKQSNFDEVWRLTTLVVSSSLCYNNIMIINLEQIIQIISILGFFSGAVMFFVKTGEYKTNISKDIEVLKHDVNENEKEIKDLHKEFEKLRTEQNQYTTRFETLLMEVKTRIDLLMQVSGIFRNKNNSSSNNNEQY